MAAKLSFAIDARCPSTTSPARDVKSSSLGTISVAIDPHQHFIDLWREAERRFVRAYGSDIFLGFYFSTLSSATGAPFLMDDTIADYYHNNKAEHEHQLSFHLHDIRNPDTLPALTPLRPPNFRQPKWSDLTAAQKKTVEKRRTEESELGEHGAISNTGLRVDRQGFKIPSKPSRTPASMSQNTQGATVIFSSQTESPQGSRARSQSHIHASASPSKRRRLAPTVSRASSRDQDLQAPPTPDSMLEPTSSQSTPPSAQRPLSSQTTFARPQWRSINKRPASSPNLETNDIDPIDDLEEFAEDIDDEDFDLDDDINVQSNSQTGSIQSQPLSTPSSSAFLVMASSQRAEKNQQAIIRGAASDWSAEEDDLLLKGLQMGWTATQILKSFPAGSKRTQSSLRNRKAALRKRNRLQSQPPAECSQREPSIDLTAQPEGESRRTWSDIESSIRPETLPNTSTASATSASGSTEADSASSSTSFSQQPRSPQRARTPDLNDVDGAALSESESEVFTTPMTRTFNETATEILNKLENEASGPRTTGMAEMASILKGVCGVDESPRVTRTFSEDLAPTLPADIADSLKQQEEEEEEEELPSISASRSQSGKLKRPANGGMHSRIVQTARRVPHAARQPSDVGLSPQTPKQAAAERAQRRKKADHNIIDGIKTRDEEKVDSARHQQRKIDHEERLEAGREPRKYKDPLQGLVHMPNDRNETPVDGEIDRTFDYSTDSDDKSFVSMPPDDDSDFREASDDDVLSEITTRTFEEVEDEAKEEVAVLPQANNTIGDIKQEALPDFHSLPIDAHPQVVIDYSGRRLSSASVAATSEIFATESSHALNISQGMSQQRRSRGRAGAWRRTSSTSQNSTSQRLVSLNGDGPVKIESLEGESARPADGTGHPAAGNFSNLLSGAHIPKPPKSRYIARSGMGAQARQILQSDESDSQDDSD